MTSLSTNRSLCNLAGSVLIGLFANSAFAQTCTPVTTSGTYNGVDVTVALTNTVQYGSPYTSCGVTTGANAIYAGTGPGNSKIVYSFSSPQTTARVLFSGANSGESASFSFDVGTPTVSVNASSCTPPITGATVTFPGSDDGADLQVTGSQPFNTLTIDVPVIDQSGSLLDLCAESIAVAPLTPQEINFTSTAPSPAIVGATYEVAATGGASGEPVVLAIDASASAVCSIAGNTVSLLAEGTCVINADQAGNATYEAAPQAQQSFSVTAAPVIPPQAATPVPTLGAWGLAILTSLLGGFAVMRQRRKS
ncbi:IPTL-CTERM sorting domain-containing protein [Comamonas koreensis]|uniref:IPTL-CTERM sorting domain-containing protein n=1 Tax=Comamonas koreensis TaxID=160825 RepID=UPI0015FBB354|nr:IPTL-CTERM sorting domain-containing protein [Comamonas koreensis]